LAPVVQKLAYPTICALAFHNGWENRNTDVRINTANDLSMYDKNLMNFCSVTPELRRTGYTLGFVTHF